MHLATTDGRSDALRHDHRFLGEDHARNARRTAAVVAVTAAMMVVEITAGWAFGSMALLADGWHMATHAGAIGVAALAYRAATRRAGDPRFAFGAGKIGDLAGFTSAIVLGLIALAIAWESVVRLAQPTAVAYEGALWIAALGLGVNVVCALLLGGHGHDHGDDHVRESSHPHGEAGEGRHGHADHNLRGAYLHVIADALTSVLAIVGLGLGWRFGWTWIDPAIGVLGAVLIASWSIALARDTGRVLVDATPDAALEADVRRRIETDDVRITDLHLWRVGPGHMAAIIAVVTHHPEEPSAYKARLAGLASLSHVTVEVNRCPDAACAAA